MKCLHCDNLAHGEFITSMSKGYDLLCLKCSNEVPIEAFRPFIRQYFCVNRACEAMSPSDSDCICWHDEGTGPYSNIPYKLKGSPLLWRERSTSSAS